jgi:hypothetical protein
MEDGRGGSKKGRKEGRTIANYKIRDGGGKNESKEETVGARHHLQNSHTNVTSHTRMTQRTE